MKKLLLFVLATAAFNVSFAQYDVFMEMLENKKICNREDQLTYFLQSRSYERQNEDHYYHREAVNGRFTTTCVINQNECYVVYQTDNAKDYNKIKSTITNNCHKEFAADKSEYYVCNEKRMQDVQVIFNGYLQEEKTYEILVYQNPDSHEHPYMQTDRVAPGEDKVQPAHKAKKKLKAKPAAPKSEAAKAPAAATVPATKTAATAAPAPKPAAPAVKAPASGLKPAPSLKPAPPVKK